MSIKNEYADFKISHVLIFNPVFVLLFQKTASITQWEKYIYLKSTKLKKIVDDNPRVSSNLSFLL